MTTEQVVSTPNVADTAPAQNAVPSLDSIAQKMAAMRNQLQATNGIETGSEEKANSSAPVVPEGTENDTSSVEPEVDTPISEEGDEAVAEGDTPQEVSAQNTTADEIIDFLEFTQENPNAKFKFMRNGKEMVIDAKRAAAILGQGGAIHEEARELKIQKAEFDEYLKTKSQEIDGLTLALEFTVRPQIQKAYDEIIRVQNFQNTFAQQLAQTQDPAQQARIRANMQQNERYIAEQGRIVQQIKPNIEEFRRLRQQQVQEQLQSSRKQFKDKELKNEYVYNEIREKVSKIWPHAKTEIIPGVPNIDLISSDEHLLSLIRDGLKYRDRPKAKSSGASIAALTNTKARTAMPSGERDEINDLRKQARGGDKKAADNLLMAQLRNLRAGRR